MLTLDSFVRTAVPLRRSPYLAGTHAPAQRGLSCPPGLSCRRPSTRRRGRQSLKCRAFKEGEQEAAAPPTRQPGAEVTFRACHHVQFGQVLKVVGGGEELGDWDVGRAPAMEWSEGDCWLLALRLPQGAHEFKLVVAKQTGGGAPAWEPGTNRALQVPAAEARAKGEFSVVCEWGKPEVSLETLPVEEVQPEAIGIPAAEPAATDSDEGEPRPEDLTAEPYPPAGDEGEGPVSTVGKMTAEGQTVEGQLTSAPDAVESVVKMTVEGQPEVSPASQGAGTAAESVGKMTVEGQPGSPAPEAPKSEPTSPTAAAQSKPQAAPSPAAGSPLGKAAARDAPTAAPSLPATDKAPAGEPAAALSEGPAVPPGPAESAGSSRNPAQDEAAAEAKEPQKEPQKKPARTGGSGGSSASDSGDAHAPVGMEAGDFPSQTPMGEGAAAEVGGEPAGSLKPETEAAVKKDMQQEAAASPGLFARLLQALTGSKGKRREQDDDDYDDNDESGSGGGGTSSGSASGSAKRDGGASSHSRGAPGQDPPTGMQLAVSAVGLAALPIVGWSEWVLKSTGCGLPPGPAGALGAAEGLSYLVVAGVAVWSATRKLRTGTGLPAGPAGLLGAVEGGSWLAVASGLAVLALQWQTYGYIPSALPDSNCFGQPKAAPGFVTAQAPSNGLAAAAARQRTAPALAAIESNKAADGLSSALRLRAGPAESLPQANLLFSLEAVLSQSGSAAEAAETAAAAMAAVAAGQPPPAQVAAAVQHLQHRAEQAQQLVSAFSTRLGAVNGLASAEQPAAAPQPQPAAPSPEPLGFQPPRHHVRRALAATWTSVAQSDKVRAVLAPVPLPAVAKRAAVAAEGGVDAVEAAAERTLVAVGREEGEAVVASRAALSTVLASARQNAAHLQSAAEAARGHLSALVPHAETTAKVVPPQQATPAAPSKLPAAAARPPMKPTPAATTQPGLPMHTAQGPPGPGAMFGAAVSDLREGFVGLWHSAREFDPAQAAAVLRERAHQQAPMAAAAAAKPATAVPQND